MTTPQPGNPGPPERAANVHAVRRFTRFYTQRMGILERRLLDSPYSVAQARVLYEIAHHETATSSELASELDLDAGYLSRIVKGFEEKGLVVRQTSKADGRRMPLSLTDAGREAFALLNSRSSAKNGAMLDALSPADERRLVEAMATIEALLGAEHPRRAPFILRPPQSGDIGWTVFRQGQLYKQEHRFDESFEALIAQITGKFAATMDPERERWWIAEMEGEVAGSVFLSRESEAVARLRLLYVEPRARGHGIGLRLVDEVIAFARQRGYRSITLWTMHVLSAARRIYENAGFRLVSEKPVHQFGRDDLKSQDWELGL